MIADLGIDQRQYSWITGAFQAGIMCQPLAGYLLDLLGLRDRPRPVRRRLGR